LRCSKFRTFLQWNETTIYHCNVDIAWDLEVQGDNVVCVDEDHVNITNLSEEEEIINEKGTELEVKDGVVLDCIVGEEDNTDLNDGSEKGGKEENIHEESKIEPNNGDEIAKEECDFENDNNNEDSKENGVHINENSSGITEATPDKLATMMRDRISAINNIRGLLEVTENSKSNYIFA
jgi:hypothetical protein